MDIIISENRTSSYLLARAFICLDEVRMQHGLSVEESWMYVWTGEGAHGERSSHYGSVSSTPADAIMNKRGETIN